MTTASVAENPIVRKARDTVLTLIGHLPRARKQMALKMGRAHLMTQAAVLERSGRIGVLRSDDEPGQWLLDDLPPSWMIFPQGGRSST
jgi:hypothetical protein